MIFERYKKISLSNECAKVMSTYLEKVKILEGLSIFDLENITTVKIWFTRYILQSSKMTDPFKDQMPL